MAHFISYVCFVHTQYVCMYYCSRMTDTILHGGSMHTHICRWIIENCSYIQTTWVQY